jgi:hypothetical protein
MKILFSNDQTIALDVDNSALGQTYQRIYKNLSTIPLDFRPWYNPYYLDHMTYAELIDQLILCANKLSITVDRARCESQDQTYFNDLHKIYENGYDGRPAWLDFHEHVHLSERFHRRDPDLRFLLIDYREKSGPLERPFDMAWMANATTQIPAGSAYVNWSELGKIPYEYWLTNEPDDVDRMCQLIKPWITLRPKISIALEDIDTVANKPIAEFESWWNQYKKIWCQHWNLPDWTVKDIFSYAVFGQVADVELLKTNLKNNITPVRILL